MSQAVAVVLAPTDPRIDAGYIKCIRLYAAFMAWQEVESGARTSKAILLTLLIEAFYRIIDNLQINVKDLYLKLADLANSPIGYNAFRDAMFVTTKTGEPLTKEKLLRTVKALEADMQKIVQTAYLKAVESKSLGLSGNSHVDDLWRIGAFIWANALAADGKVRRASNCPI